MLKILLVYDDFQELTSVELMLKKIGFDVVGITSEFSLAEQLLAFNPQVVVAQGQSAKLSSAGVGKRLRESLRWDGQTILIFYPNAKPHPADILKMRMDVGLEYPVEPTKMVQVLAQLGGLDANQLLDKLIKNMAQESRENNMGSASPIADPKNEAVYVSGGKNQNDSAQNLKSAIAPDQESGRVENKSLNTGSASEPMPVSLDAPQPTFPLNPQDGDPNQAASSPFEMGTIQDPLLQELEDLLQKNKSKPQAPPALNDPLRAEKYARILGQTDPISLSSIKRQEAKSRMKDMVKNISKESLRDQDDLRREFVKALFKRKG